MSSSHCLYAFKQMSSQSVSGTTSVTTRGHAISKLLKKPAIQQGRLSYDVALEICQRASQQECLGDTFSCLCKLAADVVLDKFRDLDAVWADEERRKAFLELPLEALKVRKTLWSLISVQAMC